LEELATDNIIHDEQRLSLAWVRFTLDVLETVLLAAILFLTINTFSARVRVEGFSMVPTLQDGEFVLVNRLAYRIGQPQRGDIIVFHHPAEQQREDLIKRVIGLPGDSVRIENGSVTVNGVQLKEPTSPQSHPTPANGLSPTRSYSFWVTIATTRPIRTSGALCPTTTSSENRS